MTRDFAIPVGVVQLGSGRTPEALRWDAGVQLGLYDSGFDFQDYPVTFGGETRRVECVDDVLLEPGAVDPDAPGPFAWSENEAGSFAIVERAHDAGRFTCEGRQPRAR